MKSERQETANNLVMYVHADTENASEFGVKLLFKNNFFKIKHPPPQKNKKQNKTPQIYSFYKCCFLCWYQRG